MKKKIFAVLILGLVVLELTACVNKQNEYVAENKSNIELAKSGVSLSIQGNTLTSTGATLVLKNDSKVDIQYGNPYEIEIKKDGQWQKLDGHLNFTLPAFILKSNESIKLELNWESGYGELESGEYRIIKSIDVDQSYGYYDSFNVTAEFIIE